MALNRHVYLMKHGAEWLGDERDMSRRTRRRNTETEEEDYCARKAASRETVSPSGLVRTSCCGPEERAGVVKVSVFISLKVTASDLPPSVAVVPDWKPLPVSVTEVPPAAAPAEGASVPMPRGTLASLTRVRPEVVSANKRWPYSSMVRKAP